MRGFFLLMTNVLPLLRTIWAPGIFFSARNEFLTFMVLFLCCVRCFRRLPELPLQAVLKLPGILQRLEIPRHLVIRQLAVIKQRPDLGAVDVFLAPCDGQYGASVTKRWVPAQHGIDVGG